MADDPNPALRAELLAALAVLAPQIRGLYDLADIPASDGLEVAIARQIAERERRRDLINAAIAALDGALEALNALEADGYPALPTAPLRADMLAELQGEHADIETAVGLFTQLPTITFGTPTFTTQPAPTQPGP